jgi:pimeloyl-ACP methyl ester carboxylesterase
MGYICRSEYHDCKALSNQTDSYADPLTTVLPRYRLCDASEITTVHGLPVLNPSTFAEIAFYSNMGPLDSINTSAVDMALIVVHGAARNGDDYICSAKATLELQNRFSNVLIIAPNFYSAADDRPRESLLYWDSKDTNGNWRYGADSSGPVHYSSFSVLDQLVRFLQAKFTNIQMITVAGHSSGGQLVQRWALLSGVSQSLQPSPWLRTVVANPSNYAYLSPERFIDGIWKIPDTSACPGYDQWEWGLADGGKLHVPYRDGALSNGTSIVLERYKSRNVIYMIGGVDRCNVSGSTNSGWCHSHGLETKCMDQLQGKNRFERNAHYFASLLRLGYGNGNHRHVIVPDVGHDHSMMFQSQEGIQALYYEMPSLETIEQ